jgi:hypothetical protein
MSVATPTEHHEPSLWHRRSAQVVTSDVLPSVIQATRLTLVLVALGLLLVGISIPVPPALGVIFEYCATFSLIIALAVTQSGIWRAEREWLRHSSTNAAKWIGSLATIATLGGLVGLYAGEVKDVLKAVVETAFNFFAVLLVLYVLYLLSKGPRRRRHHRRRRRW